MTRIAPNVELHPTKPATYIVYDKEGQTFQASFRNQEWVAIPLGSEENVQFRERTLDELSAKIGESQIRI